MNLRIVLRTVAALEAALAELVEPPPAGYAALEDAAKRMALASGAEALSRSLERSDREPLALSRPAGSRAYSRHPRAFATTMGDITFGRTLLLEIRAALSRDIGSLTKDDGSVFV